MFRGNSSIPYDFSNDKGSDEFWQGNFNSDVKCIGLQSVTMSPNRQTWFPRRATIRDLHKYGFQLILDILSDFSVFVFPFTEILSFILLSFYISSSMTNPIIFFIVAHQYNKVNSTLLYLAKYLNNNNNCLYTERSNHVL